MPSFQFLLQPLPPRLPLPSSFTTQISHASDFVFHYMKGEGDCSEQHFLPSIFEMPTSLRPTVKVSDSERASTYPIITTLCQVFFLKNLEKKVVFFLSKLCTLTSPPPPARAQTPVVMISVTESGNYWTILFTPLARSELTRAHTPTRLQIPFSFRQEIRDFGQSVQPRRPRANPIAKIPLSPAVLCCASKT